MFGYIKPCKPELKIKEYDAYRAVYCGLCKQMGASFGCFARLALSYDFTFLCALAYGLAREQPRVELRRCCVNPLQKVPMCVRAGEGDEVLSFGADVALILIYYKLLDNIQDSGFFRKFGWRLLKPFASRAHFRAAGKWPEIDRAAGEAMEAQRRLEEAGTASIDEASEPTAAALGEIFETLSQEPGARRILRRIGYLLGRYVYLCDALDDLEEDVRRGGYNPFSQYLEGDLRGGRPETGQAYELARSALFLTAGEVGKAYDLLDLTGFGPVLDNVIHLGLAAGVEEILAKKEKREHDGSL